MPSPSTSPARLPSRPPARTERRRELRSAVLAVLGLLAVLIGVPVALALAVGNPLPSTAPSRGWLTAQVTAGTVLDVLAVALWLAWAHFAVCVLVEFRAARRGRGLPGDVPLGGGSQHAARRLVAAALLLAGAATLVPSGGAPTPAPPSSISISAVQAAAPVATPPAPAPAVAPVAAAVKGPDKTYVVTPPDARRYDSLWDIAERTLGDPYRYREIFELNKARTQDDGRTLRDANLIHPGWVLRLPADASGPGVQTPAVTPQQRPAPAAPSAPEAPAAPAAPVAAEAAIAQEAVAAAPVEQSASVERLVLGGGLLAAGVAAALSARRGPYARSSDGPVELQLRLAAAPGRAELLDRALRGLGQACAAALRPLPEIAVAYLDDEHVTLSLIGTAGEPPAPWTPIGDGRGWTVRAVDLPGLAPDVAAPYPALVAMATSDGADVLVDLESAPGLVSLDGDAVVAREIATSMVVELATNLWSDGVLVTVVGFGDDLAAVAPGSVTAADTLGEVLTGLEDEHRAGEAALRQLGVQGVLSGRLLRGAERRRPRVVVLSGPPTPQEGDRLQALVGAGRTPLAVVGVGAAGAARWRFTADASGMVDLGVLGLSGPAHRLSREAYLSLSTLLSGADQERAGAGAALAALTPRAALEEVTGTGGPAATAMPAAAAPAMPTGLPAVEVRLLGPVEVLAPGPVDAAQRPLLTELVVSVAVQRDGLHEAVLRSQVWPRGVSDDVLAASVHAAQLWLGDGADQQPRLRRDPTGRWVLGGDVHTDIDVLQACAAHGDGPGERAALEHALSRISGPALSGAPAGRFGSLALHRAARDARVLGTAVARRAAGLAVGAGDPAAAERALRAGLLLVPAAEPLWRDLLRLVGDTPSRSAEIAAQAYAALAAAGLTPEAETQSLVAHLAPGLLAGSA